jgi:glutathione synthase/RimK-type ligase-like ATP-grasp enzyme
MTPQEKAKELIEKYLNMNDGLIQEFIPIPIEGARQCALIAVDQLMQHAENSYYNKDIINGAKLYWDEVKQEIEKL